MEISAIVGSVEAAKRGKAENEEGGPMTEENEGQRTAAPGRRGSCVQKEEQEEAGHRGWHRCRCAGARRCWFLGVA